MVNIVSEDGFIIGLFYFMPYLLYSDLKSLKKRIIKKISLIPRNEDGNNIEKITEDNGKS